ncbi:uncharacterized protein N7511_001703 [Penicillium nucicola]|uniref:uncharacterized protein n=1 Tax=Penicillium nucicola TaxID=1850975 RepID=UPI0025458FB0|nr:uncharacterized protein N7511_001703 [Penicillium nucicola]KAJ5776692.1 hypothetical protein N7511_001703 [Penicillium nucicola]
MDHPTSPSPIGRAAKRQCRESQRAEDKPNLENHPQESSNCTIIEPKIAVASGALTAEFMKILQDHDTFASPALKQLDLYFCLWECYVVKSAEKLRLEDEQRQLREFNEWLTSDRDVLLELCEEQALVLWDRKRAVQALCNGVVSALQASDPQACHVDGA